MDQTASQSATGSHAQWPGPDVVSDSRFRRGDVCRPNRMRCHGIGSCFGVLCLNLVCLTLAGTSLPAADLIPLGPRDIVVSHIAGDAATLLPETRCAVRATFDLYGTNVQWTAHPFIHREHPTFQADCRLQIRVLQAQATANWRAPVMLAQTNIAEKQHTATVMATSDSSGSAIFGIQAAFIPSSTSRLAAGDYVSTVVGTITSP